MYVIKEQAADEAPPVLARWTFEKSVVYLGGYECIRPGYSRIYTRGVGSPSFFLRSIVSQGARAFRFEVGTRRVY
jgi:hypothetical protein